MKSQKQLTYRDYSKLTAESLKNDLILDSHDSNYDYLQFKKKKNFVNGLNKYGYIKKFRGNHQPHIKTTLRWAVTKIS